MTPGLRYWRGARTEVLQALQTRLSVRVVVAEQLYEAIQTVD